MRRERLKREDRYVARIQQTLTNLAIDPAKHKPFEIDYFLTIDAGKVPLLDPKDSTKVQEGIPAWKVQKENWKAWTAGATLRRQRTG